MFAEHMRRSEGFRIVLQQSSPALAQILFRNKYLVPASRLVGPLVGFRFGKSNLGIWQVGGERSI